MKILPFLFPLLAFAGEDISTPQDHSGHRIEQVQSVYGIGSIGAGRFNSESSVALGAGVGIKLATQDRLNIFGELSLNHFGTYHTGTSQCATFVAAAGETRRHEYPKPVPTTQQCATTQDAQDYVGALVELKGNLDIDRGWSPFATLGAAIGDLDGLVWGLGLQWGKMRVQYRDLDDANMVSFSVEFW